MDTSDGYEFTWHEDDELHQAEGRVAVRLGISIEQAVHTIHRRAQASALTRAEIATQMLDEAPRPTR
ncbi:hypothetical protein ACQPX6_12070 [Actinomycetospora sp. CA-101289]|uniref:hypothetical protein n=1 Tax=Actinomycetospora sp. CA-101289 TaxID=3239893 RepID=UPI003D99DEAC